MNEIRIPISKRILRLPKVIELTGYSRSAIYLKISTGSFPAPISLGGRAVGWLEGEILNWIDERSKIRPLQKHKD